MMIQRGSAQVTTMRHGATPTKATSKSKHQIMTLSRRRGVEWLHRAIGNRTRKRSGDEEEDSVLPMMSEKRENHTTATKHAMHEILG